MTNTKQDNDKGMNPIAAGVVGAAVGVAAGVAAVELSKEENRDAVVDKFEELKDKGEEVISKLQGDDADNKGKK